jgi:hypothetical protein
MALPASGQISLSDLNVEFGRSATAQIGMYEAENGQYNGGINQGNNPGNRPNGLPANAITEWYGYSHCHTYTIENPDMNYDVFVSYFDCCTPTTLSDYSLGPGQSINLCCQQFPSAGGGIVTRISECGC